MKKIFVLFFVFLMTSICFSLDLSIVEDSCTNGTYNYNSYAGITCDKCGYHKDRLYLNYSADLWDWYINVDGKEKMFSNRSQASFNFLNGANGTYDLLNGGKILIDLIPAGVSLRDSLEAIAFIIKNVQITTPVAYENKDKPAFIEVYKIITANTTSSGVGPIYPPDRSGKWVWTKGQTQVDSDGNITLNTSVQYEDSNPRYYQTVSDPHYECYVGLVSWCGDGTTDSSYGEQCDNGTDNWDGNGTPIIKNGVVCNTSCQIVYPQCGSAAKTYSADATSFDGDFCQSPSSLDGPIPSFPSQGNSISWSCKLGDETTTCIASREKSEEQISSESGGGSRTGPESGSEDGSGTEQPQCGSSNGQTFDSQPTTGLCDAGISSTVTENTTSWTWTCSENGNRVNCEAYKSTCAIAGTCTIGDCGNFDGQIFDPTNVTDQTKLLKFENPQASDPDFCRGDNGDTMLSYNPDVDSKEFKWYCGNSECKAYIQYNNGGLIKIYGSYTGNTICPECESFNGADLDLGTNKLFYSDIDNAYTRSIMSGDYLPFGWILPSYNTDYVTTCDASNVGKYNKSTVKVQFKVYDYNGNLKYTTSYLNGFGGNLVAFNDVSVNGQGYIPASETGKLPLGENKVVGYIVSRQVCKGYDTDGDGITDTYDWQTESTNIPFASQTFVVTDSYLLQNSPLSVGENTNIYFNGKSLTFWLQDNNYPVSSVVLNYDKTALSQVLSGFIKNYATFATLCGVSLAGDSSVSYCKIPFEEVYYENGSNVVLPEGLEFTQPTTLIIENADVTVRPNIKGSFMLIVKNGKIKIENQNMNTKSVLEGYYITDKGFEVTGPARSYGNILNTNPYNPYWYADGRLEVNGALIGPNAEYMYKRRRSFMVGWFDPTKGSAWAIYNGASLKINSDSLLWTNPPVGSKDLFQNLRIQKGY